ncbi:MAG: DUF362 domain-containing protein [Myxococcota bacterium]
MNPRPVICFSKQRDYEIPLPFHPPERYPELDFLDGSTTPENEIYADLRRMLAAQGYDREHFGSAAWSPLSDFVAPAGTIVLKPNFVRHYNEDPDGVLETVVTHPAVLRPLIDYALKAVGPEGRVIIADAPQYECDIEALLAANRLPELLTFYRESVGREVEFRDLRVQFGRHDNGVVLERRDLVGDPEGYEAVDLGDASEFAPMNDRKLHLLRGADYDEEVTIRHHSSGRHQYLVSRTVLTADLVINVPKIKTHKKSGVTLSMKNLIGINGDKNWLPHYRSGFTKGGGDEFPQPDFYSLFRRFGADLARQLLKRGLGGPIFRRIRAAEESVGLGRRARNGNWFGNDTIWRTCLDLNKVFYFGDKTGKLSKTPGRRVLNVYDGIIAGEGDGPMGPRARPIGLLALGEDGGAVDVILAWIMGFDWRRIPVLANAIGELGGGVAITRFDGDPARLELHWIDEDGERDLLFSDLELNLGFDAHPGWAGQIEREVPADLRNVR